MTHPLPASKKLLKRLVSTISTFAIVFLSLASIATALINSVTITSPNGGEAWSGTQNITWTCSDNGATPKCSDTTVNNITYSFDNGTTWENAIDAGTGIAYIPGTLFANAGTFSWDTTGHTDSTTGGLVMIVLNSPSMNDTSDAIFILDNTPATILSATTNDVDGNGKVDQLIVVLDETMNNTITSTAGITYGAFTLVSDGVWSTTTNTDDTLTIAVTENSTGGCDYGDQTGCDTDDTSNVAYAAGTLQDLAGNGVNAYSAAATDGAKPAIVGAETDDIDANGQIDTIYTQFSEDLNGGTVNGTGTDFVFDLGYASSAATETSNGFVTITLAESGTPDTGITPTVSIASGQTVQDLAGNPLSNGDAGSSILSLDGADPVAITIDYRSLAASPASVDRFYIEFSEGVSINGNLPALLGGLTVASGGLSGFAGPVNSIGSNVAPPTANIFFVTNGVTTDLTGVSGGTEPQLTYTNNPTGQLEDPAGNAWQSMAITSMIDGASPVVIDDLSLDVNGDGNNDAIEYQVSEGIEDADFTASALADWLVSTDAFATSDAMSTFSTTVTDLAAVGVANDDFFRLSFTPSNTSGTGVINYSYTNDNSPTDDITDATSNALQDIASTATADGADPVVIELRYTSSAGNGIVNNVIAVISENVSYTLTDMTDWTINNQALTNLDNDTRPDSASITGVGNEITFITSGTINLTGVCGLVEPTLAYSMGSGKNVSDAASNNLQLFAATSINDYARPMHISTSTTAGTPTAHPIYGTTANSITDIRNLGYTECLAAGHTDTTGGRLQNAASGNDIDFTVSVSNSAPTGTLVLDLDDNDEDNNTGRQILTYDSTIGTLVDDSAQANKAHSGGPTTLQNFIAPVSYKYVYQSSGQNDVVDRALIFLTETVTDSAAVGDWAINDQNLTSFSGGTPTSKTLTTTDYTNDTIELTTTGTSELTGVSGATEPDVTYSAPGHYTDLDAVNLASFGPTTLADEAGPIAIDNGSAYYDATNTGSITIASLRFTENTQWQNTAGTYYDDTDWTATANDLTGFDVTGSTDTNGDNSLVFNAISTSITGVGAGSEPTVSHPGGDQVDATIKDTAGNVSEAFTVTLTDAADPVLVGFVATPGFPNPPTPAGIGSNLEFDLTFSEDMNTGVPLTGTVFDLATPAGPFGVTNTSYAGDFWEGDYDSNPIVLGTPPTGTHTFTSNSDAQDPAGNIMAIINPTPVGFLDFLIDSVPPDTTGIQVNPNPANSNELITVTATVTDDMQVVSAELFIDGLSAGAMLADDGVFDSTTEKVTLTVNAPVTGGVHTVYILSTDLGSNTEFQDGENTETLTVNAAGAGTGPEFYITQPTAGATVGPDFTLAIDTDGTATSCEYATASFSYGAGTTMTQTGTSWYANLTSVPNGTPTYYVVCTNGTDTTERSRDFTVEAPDTTEPTLRSTSPNAVQITGSVAPIVFILDEDTIFADIGADDNVKGESDLLNFTLDTTDILTSGNTTAVLSNSDTTLTVTYTDANLAVGVHNLNLKVQDAAGNDRQVSMTVNVVAVADTTPPSITNISAENITQTSTTIQFDSNEAGFGRVFYGTTNTYGDITTWQSIAAAVDQEIDLAGLICGTTYHYSVEAKDGSENTDTTSDATFATVACTPGDTTPPALSIITAESITQTSATIQFETDENGSARVFYGATNTYGDITTWQSIAATGSANQQIPIAGLTCGTTYHYSVEAKDGSENTDTTSDATFATVACTPGDTTPPSGTITTTAATVNTDFYTISGTLTADSDDVTVTIDNGTGDVGTTVVLASNISWSVVVPLPQNIATTFSATAVDENSNSAGIGSVIITEDPTLGVDSTPPAGMVTTMPATVDADFYTIAGTLTADTDPITITIDNGTSDVGTTVVAAGNTAWNVVVPLPQNTATTFSATAWDLSGNSAGLVSFTLVTITEDSSDTTAPTPTVSITNISTATADIIIAVDENSDYQVLVDDNNDFSSAEFTQAFQGSTAAGPFVVNVTGLSADTLYYAQIVVSDNINGTGNTRAVVYAFQTNEENAPILTDILLTPDSATPSTDAAITWNTKVDNDGAPGSNLGASNNEVEYGTTTSLGSTQATSTGNNVAAHSASLTGLSANTVYYYRVKSMASGKTSYSQIFTFTTARGDNGLYTDSIVLVKSTAKYDLTDPWTNGWHFRFEMTADSLTERYLRMKLDNWVSGTNTLATHGNNKILVSSGGQSNPLEATIAAGVDIETKYDTGTTVDIDAITDNNSLMAGKQFVVDLFVQIPSGQAGGSYNTSYGLANQAADTLWSALD